MNEIARRLHADIDDQISGLPTRSDPPDDDEPQLTAFATRLRSLHAAVRAQEQGAA
jgi:hypothetical protein